MGVKFADRVRETTVTTGIGPYTLSGTAPLGLRTFGSVLTDGDQVPYTVADQSGPNWEVGIGTWFTTGNMLVRTTVLSSSNGGSAVNFGSGMKDVWIDASAALLATGGNVFGASGANHSQGAVPDPGASSGTTHFLREDATWQAISFPVTSVNSQTGAVSLSTSNIPEGSNLYFTSLRAAAAAPVQTVAPGDASLSSPGSTGNVTLVINVGHTNTWTALQNFTGGVTGFRPTNTQSGTTYTLVATDAGKRIKLTNSAAVTLTVTKSATVAWSVDTEIDLEQYGAGQVTVSPDTGVTINSYQGKTKLAGQYAAATLKYEGSDVWSLVGNLG